MAVADDSDAGCPAGAPTGEAERVRWTAAVAAAEVGSFDWDLRSGRLEWDDQLLVIFGLTREAFGESIDDFTAALHPDDVGRVDEELRGAIATCSEYAAEYRVLRPDGEVRWVQARGKALCGPDGSAVRVVGAAYDTTARHVEDVRVARVLETMPAAFFLLDDEWRFRHLNAEAERILGRRRVELLGRVIWDVFPATLGSAFEHQYRAAVTTGLARSFEAVSPVHVDRWYEVRAWPGPDGLSVYFSDCTDRRRSQEEAALARERAEAEQRAADEARRLAEAGEARLRLLGEVGDDLASTLDTEEAVARLARHLVPSLASWCLITLSTDQHHLRDIASWHADPRLRETVARYARLRLTSLSTASYLFRALRTGEVVEVPDATHQIAGVLTGEAVGVLRELAPGIAYAVPLRARGRTVGAMTLFLDEDREPLSPEDVAMTVQLADRAGLALDNARLYEEQRHMAESLQRALLSAPVHPDRINVAVRYLPASKAAQVGGDWYDAFLQRSGAAVLVVGDVIGHDTQAAAAMSQVRTLLRGIGYASGSRPGAMLQDLDEAMCALQVDTMATAVVLRLEQDAPDGASGLTRARWSSAGHLPPIVAGPDGKVEVLAERNGPLLGLRAGAERPERDLLLERGSVVLLYSDGLVERRGEHLSHGIERLRSVLADAIATLPLTSDPDDLERVVDDVLERMLDGHGDDDVAVVAVHVAPGCGADR
ncbi:SpoIIE family protein phosphatase [Cellulomonas sp.]|uniref:SpoIIE family protein phosphatase n=1 Tax=Cellulomonas sp. TaxID=40001 RepID=UPI0025C5C0D3|nr:SpoIIE family protein phosphatase [Cellulomonas sp.]